MRGLASPLPPGQIRLSDPDLFQLFGDFEAGNEVADAASARAAEWSADALPPAIAELEELLMRAFHMPQDDPAIATLRKYMLRGWALGTLEEERGVAKRDKTERRYVVALNSLEGGVYEDMKAESHDVAVYAEACYLGVSCAYYLRRNPKATAWSIADYWQRTR